MNESLLFFPAAADLSTLPDEVQSSLSVYTARGSFVERNLTLPNTEIYRIEEVFISNIIPNQAFHDMILFEVSSSAKAGQFYNKTTQESLPEDEAIKTWFTDEFNLARIRYKRLQLFLRTDVMVLRHQEQVLIGTTPTLLDSEYLELLTYRQALRDFPAACTDPRNPIWPTAPAFLLPTPA